MRVGQFSLTVEPAKEKEVGYARLRPGAVYRIRIKSHTGRPADVDLFVDGDRIGLFRLDGQSDWEITRPADDRGCFTFFAAGSEEGKAAGADEIPKEDRGLVRAVFKTGVLKRAEKPVAPKPGPVPTLPDDFYPGYPFRPFRPWRKPWVPNPFDRVRDLPTLTCSTTPRDGGGILRASYAAVGPPEGVEAGVTGLTGYSGQDYNTVDNLDYDPEGEWTTIHLRLVADPKAEAAAEVRPLKGRGRSNPVPAAV